MDLEKVDRSNETIRMYYFFPKFGPKTNNDPQNGCCNTGKSRQMVEWQL